MKGLIAFIATALFSFSVSAASTQMGPFVDCKLGDGSRDYVPSEMCKMQGGKRMF